MPSRPCVSWILSCGRKEIQSLCNIELHVGRQVNLEKVKAIWVETGCHTENLGPLCPVKKKVGKFMDNHPSPNALTIKSFPAGPVEHCPLSRSPWGTT